MYINYDYKDETKETSRTKTDFSFNKFIPMPKELEKSVSPSPTGMPNWYDWRLKHYGCKWDVSGELSEYGGELNYSFDSPWSPPTNGIIGISKIYPTLTFVLEYEEGGMGFIGELECKAGEIIKDDCRDIEYGKCPKCKEDSYKNLAGECTMCGEIWVKKRSKKLVSKSVSGK